MSNVLYNFIDGDSLIAAGFTDIYQQNDHLANSDQSFWSRCGLHEVTLKSFCLLSSDRFFADCSPTSRWLLFFTESHEETMSTVQGKILTVDVLFLGPECGGILILCIWSSSDQPARVVKLPMALTSKPQHCWKVLSGSLPQEVRQTCLRAGSLSVTDSST